MGDILYEEMYYEELTHSIMEAEQSHHLPTINSSPGKWGYRSVQVQRPENQELQLATSQLKNEAGKAKFLLSSALLFCSGPQWVG